MKLSDKELLFIRNTLYVRRMYAPIHNQEVWAPYMESLLKKVEDELLDKIPYTKNEQVRT